MYSRKFRYNEIPRAHLTEIPTAAALSYGIFSLENSCRERQQQRIYT